MANHGLSEGERSSQRLFFALNRKIMTPSVPAALNESDPFTMFDFPTGPEAQRAPGFADSAMGLIQTEPNPRETKELDDFPDPQLTLIRRPPGLVEVGSEETVECPGEKVTVHPENLSPFSSLLSEIVARRGYGSATFVDSPPRARYTIRMASPPSPLSPEARIRHQMEKSAIVRNATDSMKQHAVPRSNCFAREDETQPPAASLVDRRRGLIAERVSAQAKNWAVVRNQPPPAHWAPKR